MTLCIIGSIIKAGKKYYVREQKFIHSIKKFILGTGDEKVMLQILRMALEAFVFITFVVFIFNNQNINNKKKIFIF